jgi:hypothetical protein
MVYVVEIVKDVFPLQIKATSLHTTVFHSPRTTSISQQKQADFILYQDRDVLLLEEIGVHGQIHRSAVLYFKWEI